MRGSTGAWVGDRVTGAVDVEMTGAWITVSIEEVSEGVRGAWIMVSMEDRDEARDREGVGMSIGALLSSEGIRARVRGREIEGRWV